jgi:hypothetical protein
MTTPNDWGPHLWKILHIYTEHIGKQTNEILSTDEIRAFTNFLKSLEFAMPCAKCRAHYKRWRIQKPIDHFMHYRGITLHNMLREWLWSLHDEVNRENSSSYNSPPLETLSETYLAFTRMDLQNNIQECTKSFKKALEHSLISYEAFHKFRITLSLLSRLVYVN